MKRVLCPRHKEDTPSCVVYADGAFCYGCRAPIPLAELGIEGRTPKPKFVEDLATKLAYIDTLPKEKIRGFLFPVDSAGYYIVWPDRVYYKQRLLEGPVKYKGPAGHRAPAFYIPCPGWLSPRYLVIIEGELNALSVSAALEHHIVDILSPGSASNFLAPYVKDYLRQLPHYETITIVVDRDGPGVMAAIECKQLCLSNTPDVRVVLMDRDANEVLLSDGAEALRKLVW